jgi:hypothetical protein
VAGRDAEHRASDRAAMPMRRSDRSAKLKDPLRLIACGHCHRLIDFMDSPAHPPPDTDPSLLHPIQLPSPPAYSVRCDCGHYTFYVDNRDDKKPLTRA